MHPDGVNVFHCDFNPHEPVFLERTVAESLKGAVKPTNVSLQF